MDKIHALYCRVSTKMQVAEGDSIEHQKKWLISHAELTNMNYEIYADEGWSAKDQTRPALQKLFKDIKSGKIQSVNVYKLDRMFRSIKDLWDTLAIFQEFGVSFKSLSESFDTDSANGRLTLNVLGSVAQWEREIISERVGENMRQRAKDGKWNGGTVPYGYMKKGKEITINLPEASVITLIFNKYLELNSLRGVTQWLNSNGYRTRNNATWATSSIRRILSNPTYAGKVWWGKRMSSKITHKIQNRPKEQWIVNTGNHEAIISEKLYNAVNETIALQYKQPVRKGASYLLSGLVRCGKCDATLSGYSQTQYRCKQWKTYSSYKCHNHTSKGSSVCNGNSIKKEVLEKLVVDKILSLSESKELKTEMAQSLTEFNSYVQSTRSPLERDKSSLERENASIGTKKKTLLDRLEDGTVDNKTYKTRMTELDKQETANKNRLSTIDLELSKIAVNTVEYETVKTIVSDFKSNWENLDYQSRRNLILSLVSRVIVKGNQVKVDLFFLSDIMDRAGCLRDRGSWRR